MANEQVQPVAFGPRAAGAVSGGALPCARLCALSLVYPKADVEDMSGKGV